MLLLSNSALLLSNGGLLLINGRLLLIKGWLVLSGWSYCHIVKLSNSVSQKKVQKVPLLNKYIYLFNSEPKWCFFIFKFDNLTI